MSVLHLCYTTSNKFNQYIIVYMMVLEVVNTDRRKNGEGNSETRRQNQTCQWKTCSKDCSR